MSWNKVGPTIDLEYVIIKDMITTCDDRGLDNRDTTVHFKDCVIDNSNIPAKGIQMRARGDSYALFERTAFINQAENNMKTRGTVELTMILPCIHGRRSVPAHRAPLVPHSDNQTSTYML